MFLRNAAIVNGGIAPNRGTLHIIYRGFTLAVWEQRHAAARGMPRACGGRKALLLTLLAFGMKFLLL